MCDGSCPTHEHGEHAALDRGPGSSTSALGSSPTLEPFQYFHQTRIEMQRHSDTANHYMVMICEEDIDCDLLCQTRCSKG